MKIQLWVSVLCIAGFGVCTAYAWNELPEKKISMDAAKAKAKRVCAGQIENQTLEHEHGKWVYSFDIHGADAKIHEVQINARNGKVVSNRIETPTHEALEKSFEKNTSPK